MPYSIASLPPPAVCATNVSMPRVHTYPIRKWTRFSIRVLFGGNLQLFLVLRVVVVERRAFFSQVSLSFITHAAAFSSVGLELQFFLGVELSKMVCVL